jgi:hypothetical protein
MTTNEMSTDDLAIALMSALCNAGALGVMDLTRTLGIRRSQTERLLALMGTSEALGGLGYVEEVTEGGLVLVRLTEKGRALCADNLVKKE